MQGKQKVARDKEVNKAWGKNVGEDGLINNQRHQRKRKAQAMEKMHWVCPMVAPP